MHHRHSPHVDFAGVGADQNNFAGNRHRADHGGYFTGAEIQRGAIRPGQQHQPGKGQANTQAWHQTRTTSQHQPLQQRYERHIQRGDKGRLAAGNGLQADGLQAIAEHDRHTDEDPGLELEQRQVA